jgi:hypothetical protein
VNVQDIVLDGTYSCEMCETGKYQSLLHFIPCAKCALGSYAEARGAVTCTSCDTGFTTSEVGSVDALQCNVCAAGFGGDGITCTVCPNGTTKLSAGNFACIAEVRRDPSSDTSGAVSPAHAIVLPAWGWALIIIAAAGLSGLYCYWRTVTKVEIVRVVDIEAGNPALASGAKNGEDSRLCPICDENAPGLYCSAAREEGHFTCYACLNKHVHHNANASLGAHGGMRCTNNCANLYSDQELARACSPEVYRLYEGAKKSQLEAKISVQFQKEYLAQQQRMQSNRKEDLIVLQARDHILNNILTLKCPRCAKPFVDFTNCCALTCMDEAGNGCNAAFCVFCLTLCAGDAIHRHVANCQKNTNPGRKLYVESQVAFDRDLNRRKAAAVREYLATVPQQHVARILTVCRAELDGLGFIIPAIPSTSPFAKV